MEDQSGAPGGAESGGSVCPTCVRLWGSVSALPPHCTPKSNPQRKFNIIYNVFAYLVLWDTESHTAQAGHMSSLCKKDDLGLTGERHPTGPSDRTQKPLRIWVKAAPPSTVHITPILPAVQRVQKHHPPPSSSCTSNT